jgi:predicted 3-demethylubiquinone-9 3-methyltransferase (glyoxalase superfamily)
MSKITPDLWFDGQAEEAARFYVTLFPDSRVDGISRSPADDPSTKAGEVLLVSFTLAGQPFTGIHGGPRFPFTEAVSSQIDCEDQAEVDRLWEALARRRAHAPHVRCDDRRRLSVAAPARPG